LKKIRGHILSIILCALGVGPTATSGAVSAAESESLPGVATAAIDAGTRAADAILANGNVAGVDGGTGAYMDQVQDSLSVFPDLLLLRIKEDVLVLRIDPDTLFIRDSNNTHVAGRTLLGDMAEKLMFLKKTAIVIQVHTDARGNDKHNLRLSERRAKSIKSHLEGYNLAEKRMAAYGYGDRYPLPAASGQSNARVNILLKAKSP
jgi:outer membrane protein OmpA-like peptidoglycan-associated protein